MIQPEELKLHLPMEVGNGFISTTTKFGKYFLYANGFLLLTIVFFPFPTALLAEYINTEYAMPAIVFYSIASC
ncbi:MAG TPA: hypothetical protein VKC90_02375 [Chitinophagaceae bacterium]|nr:hypothetical protein [Chitinophagaceae bacterium]